MQANNTANGIVVGLVTDINDPAGLGRVKVRFPHLADAPSDWARLATLMAGAERGSVFRPEVGDEVLVAFEQGDPRRPYVIGALWSEVDTIPADAGNQGDNHLRLIKSRSGHLLIFDDTPGAERIVLIDKDGQRKVVIDCAGAGKIQVLCDQGSIEVKAPAGDVTLEGINVTVKASANLTLEATGMAKLKGATVTIEGNLVNIN